jgi:hypothetical protein
MEGKPIEANHIEDSPIDYSLIENSPLEGSVLRKAHNREVQYREAPLGQYRGVQYGERLIEY